MTVSLTHATVAAGTDAGNGEIGKIEWNEEHALTLATNNLLGRATAGTGAVEEIACTAAGRALLDDADAAAQRTTLGLGTGDSPQFTAVNVGAASDTTLTRTAAGVVAVEGNNVLMASKGDTISKGFNLTPNSLGTIASGASVTPDALNGNYQYLTNGSSGSGMTISAPAADCAIDILVINGASAGSITFSGFKTPGTGASGATYATTASTWWMLSIRRINGVATYNWNGPWT